ncbi:hypothetical protein B9Z55_015994 [Caenorhabditis nigoni]|uniref:Nuclear receptor domain-containing protein n=2 Tax=Caenorhabditis nigoni TaxID=1611254 RepID=A0A2G5UDL2_9PELO|nr:hypothetical protein B9Z55_015994 [Caenorhabditis nigoni]
MSEESDLSTPSLSTTPDDSGRLKNEEQRPKICQICLGGATNYHYRLAICGACKTFFIRTMTDLRYFKCKKGTNDCFDYDVKPPQEMKKGTKNKSDEEIRITQNAQNALNQAAEGFQIAETVIFENYRKSQVLAQKVENFLSICNFSGIKIRDDCAKLWTEDSKPKILSSIFCTIEYFKCFQFTRMLKYAERLKLLSYIATIFIVLNISYLDLVKKIQNSKGTDLEIHDPLGWLLTYNLQPFELACMRALAVCNPAISEESQKHMDPWKIKHLELLSSYCIKTKGPGRLAEILGILEALQMKQPRFEITEIFVSQFGSEMANGFY